MPRDHYAYQEYLDRVEHREQRAAQMKRYRSLARELDPPPRPAQLPGYAELLQATAKKLTELLGCTDEEAFRIVRAHQPWLLTKFMCELADGPETAEMEVAEMVEG